MSGAAPLIQTQASCWATGAPRPSAPSIARKSARSVGRCPTGATPCQAAAENPSTTLTPPAETSGAQSRRNDGIASAGPTSRCRSNSRKWWAAVPWAKIPSCGRTNPVGVAIPVIPPSGEWRGGGGPPPRLSVSVRRLRLRQGEQPLQVGLDQSLAADCDHELRDAGDEREGRDQGERDERAGAGPGEDHDPEQDRDQSAQDHQC